ncbi:YbjN domain-containing protein [Corynebacterium flavescens]|uniref:YbjN domain-containing protein n=1 Tax=Corynebacterium flavescens TaxID=28028 RepID=A0AB73B6C0_CORFL|nr:YbjN domain-containing protein [Corynebacterium flavescens]KAA8721390.1 YbjN domain-containing protein [Corynebacterium flavescens]GEB97378.1 hypothetical protein CFL01nite_08730 [Corynebacterium flavescens]
MQGFNPEAGEHAADAGLISRVYECARRAELECIRVESRELLFPHPHQGETRLSMDTRGDPLLRFFTRHTAHLQFGDVSRLAQFVNAWNHDCLSPTLILDYGSPESVQLWGHTFFLVEDAPTTQQIEAALLPAIFNAQSYLEALFEAFPEIARVPAPASPEEGEEPGEHPSAVDLDRLMEALPALGISRFHIASEQAIYTWINDILFAFALDNGPSLLIKGHWDPNIEEKEFLRVFLICNDWNRGNYSASAFCHINADGLQVRLDYAAITSGGLTDSELRLTLGRALRAILHGVDDIARNTVGSSPVKWP